MQPAQLLQVIQDVQIAPDIYMCCTFDAAQQTPFWDDLFHATLPS